MKNKANLASAERKTIFSVGLFPDLNKQLMQHLCQEFRVITFQGHAFEPTPGVKPEVVEDILGADELRLDYEEAFWEIGQFFEFTKSEIEKFFPDSSKPPLGRSEYKSFHASCFSAFVLAQLFRKLAEKVKIDMVVSNADYSGRRRPVIIEAKKLGIPTFNIEHGFFAATPAPSTLKSKSAYSNWFAISDYVNLDNNLEKEHWEALYSYGDVGESVSFVVNGTPNDLSFDPAISKTEALKSLDLKDEQFTVTVASTWIEAHQPSTVIDGQIDHTEFFKTTLRALAELKKANEKIQVIIKLHPAFARNSVWSDTVSYLERFADSMGLRIDLIACAKLSEIIAASDLMICPHASSLLWEFFLGDKPGIVLPMPSFYDKYDAGKLNDSNILFREKCMKYVFDQDGLVAAIHYYMNKKNYSEYVAAAHAVRKEKDIRLLTVDEKCQNICRWIEEFLSDNEQPESSAVAVADAEPDSGRADWLFQTARQLIDAGKTREGLSLLNQVLKFDSAHVATLNLMGDIYHKHGQEEQAREMWQMAEDFISKKGKN